MEATVVVVVVVAHAVREIPTPLGSVTRPGRWRCCLVQQKKTRDAAVAYCQYTFSSILSLWVRITG